MNLCPAYRAGPVGVAYDHSTPPGDTAAKKRIYLQLPVPRPDKANIQIRSRAIVPGLGRPGRVRVSFELERLVTELDAVGRQFEPYHTAGCVCMLVV